MLGDPGRDSVKDTVAGYREAFPDLTLTVEDAFGVDDKVVVRWKAEGTFENEFMGQQPTGEKGDPSRGSASTASRTARSPSPGRSGTRCDSCGTSAPCPSRRKSRPRSSTAQLARRVALVEGARRVSASVR